MQYAFGVQVYGEVLYLEFFPVFSEQFINDEILLCKRLWMYIFLWKWNPEHDKGVVDFNSYMENKFSIYIFLEFTPEYCNIQIDLSKWSTSPVQLVKD